MKVKDDRLNELADGSQNVAYFEVVSIAEELRSYRQLAERRKDMLELELGHVFGGYSEEELKQAKSNAIAYEELKQGIEQAVEEIASYDPGGTNANEWDDGFDNGIKTAEDIIRKHIPKE